MGRLAVAVVAVAAFGFDWSSLVVAVVGCWLGCSGLVFVQYRAFCGRRRAEKKGHQDVKKPTHKTDLAI